MWFEVNKDGLAKLMERRGKEFIIYELIQNAWDQNVSRVNVTLEKETGSRWATMTVEDDDPDGFADLTHAWTLFADSAKKADAQKRGRFNVGEKMASATCAWVEIISTTGSVRFDEEGRHRLRTRRDRGSMFRGRLKLSKEEFDACCKAVERLIPPPGVITTFNGKELTQRVPFAEAEAVLKTEVADAEGFLRPTNRKTTVRFYEPQDGEEGMLYELGIPVVTTGDAFHVDVQQKLPLNMDRDNVPPAYLRTIRALMLNAGHARLTNEQANSPGVRDAFSSRDLSPEAVKSIITRRFGEKAVARDPSDPEANSIAASEGYTVVNGSQLSKDEWAKAREAGVLRPAGQVTPSDTRGTAGNLQPLSPDQWTLAEKTLAKKFHRIAGVLLDTEISIQIVDSSRWLSCGKLIRATYGSGVLTINRAAHGTAWWEGINDDNLSLLIHELGHHYERDHLSRNYYRALSDLGARLALAAVADPDLLS